MASAWSGTVGDLKQLIQRGSLIDTLASGYISAFRQPPSGELTAWQQSIPALIDVLSDDAFDVVQIILELQMPVGAERADAILLGERSSDYRGYVIELKQWSEVQMDLETLQVEVAGLGLHQHPSTQVLNYRGKLHLFHALAAIYHLKSAVFLHNMSNQMKEKLLEGVPEGLTSEAPLFGKEDGQSLAQAIKDHLLPTNISPDEHIKFSEAPYEQTRHLFEVLLQHARQIADRATVALAESGIGFTEEQEQLAEEILSAVHGRHNKVFVVQGGPGSGKTLLAVTLLLRAIQQGSRCVLALRNNRLQAILRKCFDASYPGVSGMLTYFEVPRSGTGIGDTQFKGQFDLVICDEAQRMRSVSMPIVLGRAPVCAIFLDETQRLNPPEQGTIANFSRASSSVKKLPEPRKLTAAIRCRGGQPYHDWVESLLFRPQNRSMLGLSEQTWKNTYLFEVCESVQDMLQQLSVLLGTLATQ